MTGIGIVTAIIVVVAAFTIGNKPTEDQEPKTLGESQVRILLRENTHLIKAPNAKVTVVEFGDFQCPACAVAYGVVTQIKSEYKDKINFAFREFPLVAHANGRNSAYAAEAAGAQGKFWEMHDKLYENQSEWSDKNDPTEIFASYAKEIGIDVDKFKQDVKNKKYEDQIQVDLNDGNALGVNATPTFFINGKMYTGVLPYEDFKSKIESELKNK